MSGVPDSIVALLREAGWQAPPDDGARDPAGERLLASLAGLSLGKTGADGKPPPATWRSMNGPASRTRTNRWKACPGAAAPGRCGRWPTRITTT